MPDKNDIGMGRRLRATTATLLLGVMLAGCAGLQSNLEAPTVTISDLTLANSSLFEQQFNLKLRIQNPNPEDLRIDGMAFDLEINDQSFAKGVGNQLVLVPRFGSGVMSVEAVSSLGGIIAQLSALARAKNVGFKYRIKGRLSVGEGRVIPFERRGEFDWNPSAPKT